MQSSNIPTKIPLPFANAAGTGYRNTIPVNSQIGITNGRASLADGFPPLNFTPISTGGVPPFGGDMNGILYEITAIQQWQQAGGFFPFDSSFASTIGGYPKGAVLQSANGAGLWVSTIENNSNNPDTGGAGWVSLAFGGLQTITVTSADVTVTQLQSAYPVIVVSGALTGNRNLILPAVVGEWIVQNNTTGAYTLTAKTASGTGVTLTQNASTYIYGDGTNIVFADSAKVASFNGRTGTVTLTSSDVTTALGYTPYNASNPAGYITFAAGTRIPFAQASAPTGWTQDTTDAANNRLLRVVNSSGGGTGGVNDPTIMNVVPTHTHGFTTGWMNQNNPHSHGITDYGHYHTTPVYYTYIQGAAGTVGQEISGAGGGGPFNTNIANSNIGVNGTDINHTHSGSTDGGSSQTNWSPRYINLIICAKN